jgi:hypothetical protein
MTSRIFKSTWTWRTLDYQDKILAAAVPGWPEVGVYTDDEGLDSLFRPTQRKSADTIYVASIGILGTKTEFVENIAREFIKRGWRLVAIEEKIDWKKLTVRQVLDAWQYARINGAATVGSRISAKNRRQRVEEACNKISERWKLPSNIWPTKILLKEAGISFNSIKTVLGNRFIMQANYQAMLKQSQWSKIQTRRRLH